MEYLVTSAEMKRCDGNTIEHFGMPSMVLMERAALACANELIARDMKLKEAMRPYGPVPPANRVLVAAGTGNNGGDGLAIGRLLSQAGFSVDFVLLGREERCSGETAAQLNILKNYGHRVMRKLPEREYDIIIDAIFGIGLTRPVEGSFAEAVEYINAQDAYVLSVDIPSGIHGDTGEVMGCAVQADVTVTFGFRKLGLVLYPGARYAGKVICADIGITQEGFLGEYPRIFTRDKDDRGFLPERLQEGNKGTFGKVLLIAGSRGMAGACELSAAAVLRSGAGMVRAVTPESNRVILQTALPEAMLTTYGEWTLQEEEKLTEACTWADVIAIGPGLGKSPEALRILEAVLERSMQPLILDADAINLLAEHRELLDDLIQRQQAAETRRELILSPHPGEFGRLTDKKTEEIKKEAAALTLEWAGRLQAALICKGARTLVGSPEGRLYMNLTGNSGMATAGSGDVLTGILAGLSAQGMHAFDAACAGVYLHGLAGDRAAHKKSEYSVIAGDLTLELEGLFPELTRKSR